MKNSTISEKMKERFFDENKNIEYKINPAMPASLNIEVTSYCNENCIFCPYHSNHLEKKLKGHELELDKVKMILSEAKEAGIGWKEVGFHMNGEPLLYPHLSEVIKYAKDLGFSYIFTTTNGILATNEKIEELISAGLNSLRISLNGIDREEYKEVHGKDKFDTVIKNIKGLKKYKDNGKFRTSVSVVLTKDNVDKKNEFYELLNEYVDEVVFIPVLGVDRFFPKLVDKYAFDNNSEFDYRICPTPFNSMYISSTGYVIPCCTAIWSKDLYIENVFNNISLKEIWLSEKFNNIRKCFIDGKLPSSFCKNCFIINKNSDMVL